MNKSKKDSLDKVTYSYYLQEKHMEEVVNDEERKKLSETWLKDDTVDAWRHQRMKASIKPLLEMFPKSKWLTIGDGRYGTDAHFLEKSGMDVLATDISDKLLKVGKKKHFIKKYKKENAEELSFKNSSFDFVFCKESFHHFPRPMIAFYEMLRVARRGVVLIEPNDAPSILQSFLLSLLNKERFKFRGKYFDSFEKSGNYVYKISSRELEKAAIGIQLPTIAFKGMDDFYIEGVEHEKKSMRSRSYFIINFVLFILDILYKLKLRDRSLLSVIVFKAKLSTIKNKRLVNSGFKVIDLPRNPYIT